MAEFLVAGGGERTETRTTGYRAGYYSQELITRIGEIELRVARGRNGEFSTALFDRLTKV
jgi:putative transposase